MAIKTCTGTTSQPFVHVQARLSQPCTITATGLDAPLVTDATGVVGGTYSISLWAASDLTPTGTYYTVTEFLGSTDNTFNVQVPATAGPFAMSSILVGTPTASPSPNHVSTLIVDGPSGVAIDAAGNIAARSVTVSSTSPYTPNAPAGGASFAGSVVGTDLVSMTWTGAGPSSGDQAALLVSAESTSGYFNTLEGLDVYVVSSSNDNGSASDSMYGIRVQAKVTGTGSHTHVIGWKINPPTNTQAATISAVFGGYIADPTTFFTPANGSGLHFEGPNRLGGLSWAWQRGSSQDARLYATGGQAGAALMTWEVGGISLTDQATRVAAVPYQKLAITGSIGGQAAFPNAVGIAIAPTLVSAINNSHLIGLYVNPTFTDGGFTGDQHWGIYTETGIASRLGDKLTIVQNGADITGAVGLHGTTTVDSGGRLIVTGVAANANALSLSHTSAASQPVINLGPNVLTASTVGAAGAASALPATPTGYLPININGATQKIPYYN